MTISLSDNNPRISYSVSQGVTQTTFTVPFEFFDLDDLNVYVDDTQKTKTTDYTLASGGSGSTGSITMSVTGATGGSTVVITRDIDHERTTDFQTSGPFNIASLNTELDRFTAIAADLQDGTDRTVRLQDQDETQSMELPLKADRLGKVLGFNTTTGAVEATTLSSSASITAGISENNFLQATTGIADNDFLRVDGTKIEGRSASEIASDIGAASLDDVTALAIALG